MGTYEQHELRQRARHLRSLAGQVESSPVMALHRHAGSDTWRTPRAELLLGILTANQGQLRRAAEELRWQAHLLETRAERMMVTGASGAAWV
ncbi:MAG TPA: hypothetical protein VGK49_00585 [Ilumatobacteraceae bacterium]